MNANNHVVGVVIAGGRSTRFGGEKALALFHREPLLLRAARRLEAACGAVAVNARQGSGAAALAARSGLPVIHDEPGDPEGPLAGVKAALIWARRRGATLVAVSPCDAPLLPAELYPRLVDAAGEGAAMAETAEGRQPLCAVWPVRALPQLTAALTGGAHPPTWRMLEDVGASRVHFARTGQFANANTREELARLEAATHQG